MVKVDFEEVKKMGEAARAERTTMDLEVQINGVRYIPITGQQEELHQLRSEVLALRTVLQGEARSSGTPSPLEVKGQGPRAPQGAKGGMPLSQDERAARIKALREDMTQEQKAQGFKARLSKGKLLPLVLAVETGVIVFLVLMVVI